MFVKKIVFSVLFVGGPMLLAFFIPGWEPWQKYSGPVTEYDYDSFYYRTSGNTMCFVGRIIDDSMIVTYAGHFNKATAELRTYAWKLQYRPHVELTKFKATDLNASINQPEAPTALANLMLADKFPVESKLASVSDSIKNVFTESECWNGDAGLPRSLKNTINEDF
jgi:hypothetical protein